MKAGSTGVTPGGRDTTIQSPGSVRQNGPQGFRRVASAERCARYGARSGVLTDRARAAHAARFAGSAARAGGHGAARGASADGALRAAHAALAAASAGVVAGHTTHTSARAAGPARASQIARACASAVCAARHRAACAVVCGVLGAHRVRAGLSAGAAAGVRARVAGVSNADCDHRPATAARRVAISPHRRGSPCRTHRRPCWRRAAWCGSSRRASRPPRC